MGLPHTHSWHGACAVKSLNVVLCQACPLTVCLERYMHVIKCFVSILFRKLIPTPRCLLFMHQQMTKMVIHYQVGERALAGRGM